jgi:hypothetical protein
MTEESQPPEIKKKPKKKEKYIPLPRFPRTENALLRIFENGTERELMQYMRDNDLKDDNPRFGALVKLFREHRGGKPR